MLAGQLGHGIRRDRVGRHALVFGQRGSVAIGGRRCRIDHSLYLGIARRDQHVHRAIHVRAVASDRIQHRFWHRRNRGLMQNIIHAGAGQLHGIEIEDVGFTKIDLPQDLRQVFPLAGGKIVHSANLLAAL